MAEWTGPRILADVDFTMLLQQTLANDGYDSDDLSSLSSLPTSCESSRAPTPNPSALQLPIDARDAAQLRGGLKRSSPQPAPGPSEVEEPKTKRQKKLERMKQAGKKNRKKSRQEKNATQKPSDYKIRASTEKKHVEGAASPVETKFDASKFPAASSGYVSVGDDSGGKKVFKLADLVGPGSRYRFKLFDWDGSTPTPLIDLKGRVIGILAGHPDDATWEAVHLRAATLIESSRSRCYFEKGDKHHRRGRFPALACGVSHGGGQDRPRNSAQHPDNEAVFKRLFADNSFLRLAGFASATFATWCPKLYQYYAEHIENLMKHDDNVTLNFKNTVFASATVNFGPRTACFKHMDLGNLPYGMCAITALGDFDSTQGGHLVLWELGLVIRFPAGSTVLIPSASISHSNVGIRGDETRYSFTQYSAGGIFRWVDHGYQREVDFWEWLDKEGNEEERDAEIERMQKRLTEGIALFRCI